MPARSWLASRSTQTSMPCTGIFLCFAYQSTISAGRPCSAGVQCREAADGGPIEAVAALCEEAQKAVVQQACERHRHAQTLGRLQREPDVLEPERCGESGRLKPAFGDQVAVGLVSWRREDCRTEHINVGTPIDARLVHEGDGLAQSLDGGGEQEVSAELDQIRRRWLRAYRKGLRTQRVEERLARFDRSGVARCDDEQLRCRRGLRTAEDWRRDEALSGTRVRF